MGNTAGAKIKLVTIPRDENLITENPYSKNEPWRNAAHAQLSGDSVDSLLFLYSLFDDTF